MTNLAEAGFLADDLVSGDIDARIYQTDEFNALDGNWAAAYFIQVPDELAQDAAVRIRRHLIDDESYADRWDRATSAEVELPFEAVNWRPLALVVLASVASFLLGQRFATNDGQRRPPPHDSLSAAVDKIGQPLVTEPLPGEPRYRLSYDWRRDAWQLDADLDADGTYERRRHFHATGASR